MTEQSVKNLKHIYFEIGAELLSKPNALAQIIEGRGQTALVFCNTPSDTDLVEVLLKKRGVAARKLIGNVPPAKLEKTLAQLKSGEVTTLVVTDIAARGIDIDDFDLAINYTAPSDADTYAHRVTKSGAELNRLKTVATLVGPLDITNFHYVKKGIEAEFTTEELPDADTILKAKIERLSSLAAQKNIGEDNKYAPLAEAVAKHKNKNAIIALLLQNTIEVLPSLQVAAEREEEPAYDDDDTQPNFNDRGDRRDRDDRRGRRDNRRGGRDDRRGGGRDRDRDRDNGHGRRPYADLDDEATLQAEEAQQRRKPRAMLPPLREARIYYGKGSDAGMNEDALRSLVQKESGLSAEDIKRVIIRKNYAFFDVLDEQSQAVLDKLTSDGKELCIKKATVISTQRNEPAPEEATDSAHESAQPMEAGELA